MPCRPTTARRRSRHRTQCRAPRPAGYYDPYENPRHVLRNRLSLAGGRLTVQLRPIAVLASWTLFALTFLEPPSWCRDAADLRGDGGDPGPKDGSGRGYGDCLRLFAARDGDGAELYPSSGALWLTSEWVARLDLACAAVVALHVLCAFADDGFRPRLCFYPGTHKCWVRVVRCFALAGLFAGRPAWNPVLRLLLLGTYLRKLHRESRTMVQVVSAPTCARPPSPGFCRWTNSCPQEAAWQWHKQSFEEGRWRRYTHGCAVACSQTAQSLGEGQSADA